MRKGFAVLVGMLIFAVVALTVGPLLWGLFFGPGFDP